MTARRRPPSSSALLEVVGQSELKAPNHGPRPVAWLRFRRAFHLLAAPDELSGHGSGGTKRINAMILRNTRRKEHGQKRNS